MNSDPLACVIGDMDLVRPLGKSGVRCAVVCDRRSPSRFSRFAAAWIEALDPSSQAEALVERLVDFGMAQDRPRILFYQSDGDLLLVSRYREQLGRAFRFVVPERSLVENLVDKARFRVLAETLDLPVPRSCRLDPASDAMPSEKGLEFPLIVKPLPTRTESWSRIEPGKALKVDGPEALATLWPRLAEAEIEVLAQELVPGPETRIESYHVYVDAQGAIQGEFTGAKIRTKPVEYGHTTALEITESPNDAGRQLVERLRLRGVAKFDFKRTHAGDLRLLEINPRFSLWAHPGALAGTNIPALVYADLIGKARASEACAGVTWCTPLQDLLAAQEWGVPLRRWAPWALRCDGKKNLAWDDPGPFAATVLSRRPALPIRRRSPTVAGPPGTPERGL
jgi:predicted ATP-grasp superfamily ATP-dependent carboligase